MTQVEMLLTEFDRETAVTRQLLERIPEDRAPWRPHDRSRTLGELSLHVAALLKWLTPAIRGAELDLDPAAREPFPSPAFESAAATLRLFDDNVAEARALLTSTIDAELAVPWTLKTGGVPMFTMPRAAVIRVFVFNHLVHHRGQLSVYLRLCGTSLPPMYGPTADTQG